MKRSVLFNAAFTVILSGMLFTACNNDGDNDANGSDTATTINNEKDEVKTQAVATLNGTKADTTVSGTVNFTQEDDGKVKMKLQVSVPKMANQSVAIHIHENGDCGNSGNNAGGHWNPTGANHGEWDKDNFHSGDIGNISLDKDGRAEKEITSDRWSIGGDAQKDILNKTIVVHSGKDDYKSQPAGNSGSRIGCGVIQRN